MIVRSADVLQYIIYVSDSGPALKASQIGFHIHMAMKKSDLSRVWLKRSDLNHLLSQIGAGCESWAIPVAPALSSKSSGVAQMSYPDVDQTTTSAFAAHLWKVACTCQSAGTLWSLTERRCVRPGEHRRCVS